MKTDLLILFTSYLKSIFLMRSLQFMFTFYSISNRSNFNTKDILFQYGTSLFTDVYYQIMPLVILGVVFTFVWHKFSTVFSSITKFFICMLLGLCYAFLSVLFIFMHGSISFIDPAFFYFPIVFSIVLAISFYSKYKYI